MNPLIKQRIEEFTPQEIAAITAQYRKGTGLTCWDLARKYNTNFSVICYIVKSKRSACLDDNVDILLGLFSNTTPPTGGKKDIEERKR